MGARVFGLSGWRTPLELGRISNLPTVWSNVLAGAVLAGGEVSPVPLATLLLAATLFYEGGMFLNDAFDRAIDARERPERPIPSGRAAAAAVFGLGFAMLAAAIALVVPQGTAATAAGMVLALCIVAYDLHHKGFAWSPVVMGACRALVVIVSGLALAPEPSPRLAWGALALLAYVAGLTYTAKQENLAEFRNAWPLAVLAAPALPAVMWADLASLPFLALFLGWLGYALSLVLIPGRRNVRRAVGAFIAGISLLDAVLIAENGQPPTAAVAVACFGLTLALHRKVAGT